MFDFSLENAQKLIYFEKNENVVDLEIFKDYIAVFMKKNSFSVLKCYDINSSTDHTVNLPNEFCSLKSGNNFVCFRKLKIEL